MIKPHAFIAAATAGAAALVLGAAVAVAAEKQTFLGQHGDWYTYRISEDGARTCYMVSKPTATRGKFNKRGDVVAFVTHRPKEGERDVVNFQAGFAYQPKSDVTVRIGDDSFTLFTSKDTSWAKTPADDKSMVAAMIKGITMTVEGTAGNGQKITDTYSLRGFTAAHKKITSACGLK